MESVGPEGKTHLAYKNATTSPIWNGKAKEARRHSTAKTCGPAAEMSGIEFPILGVPHPSEAEMKATTIFCNSGRRTSSAARTSDRHNITPTPTTFPLPRGPSPPHPRPTSHVRLRVDETELSNIHTFKRPILHPPALQLPSGKIDGEGIYSPWPKNMHVCRRRRSQGKRR